MEWDVIVIGAGQTGGPLSARLAEAGKRVLLAERKHVGGTCSNYGCTPTKTLIASARAAHVARTAARLGIHADVRVDFQAVIRRKNELVQQWRQGTERRLARAGESLVLKRAHARFVDTHEVEVDGERHRAKTLVIDVGARPAIPRIEGLDRVAWLDNATVMELDEVPEQLVVLGGGYIGCELGQAFRRFGADVTIIDRNEHLLAREDEDVSQVIADVFAQEGISVRLGTEVRRVGMNRDAIEVETSNGSTIAGTHLLVAVGRQPNTHDLGCEAAGVELDQLGYIRVNDRYETNVPGVYASGDVTGGPQFTHTAWDDHRLLYDIILGNVRRTRQDRLIPHATFTDPQVAGIGLTERAAREQNVAYELATFPFGNIARAIETDERSGLLKVLLDPATERIIGATIVGAEAAELIHILLATIAAGAKAQTLVDAEFVHPAFAEGVQSALMRLSRYAPK
jgi:pyruvate/2-oxoglutarate dehydrogenase complex dihydrolipoamide dehydrogenase (E3) component